ncbi:EH domain-containing protein 1 [Dionaea muscipula]
MEGLDALMAKKKVLATYTAGEVNGTVLSQSSLSANWFNTKSAKKMLLGDVTSIIDGLKRLYIEKLNPLETTYHFHDFVSPALTNSDFDAKPMVMLLGQYSTGKTTFIKHLLECEYPGAHIGPEPTTDRFVVVMSGPDERSVPGNTIAVQADMPFKGLTNFGGAFLSKFQCSQMPHPLLEHITFVDTPGVLSGEKQRTQRSYDFTGVISWFAAKCDLILLLFDPHKLDISDEFKRVISSLRGHDDKIRVVLNKADQVDTQQLMRIYGALMWSLGKVLNTPEVVRVYIGRSWFYGEGSFEKEQNDLLGDLRDIPKKACDRRINEFVKRARAAKIHAYIISHLKKEMPSMMGKSKVKKRLIDNLEDEFAKVQREFHLPAGDFPYVEHFREVLTGYNIDKFEKLKPKLIQGVDDMLAHRHSRPVEKFRKSLRNENRSYINVRHAKLIDAILIDPVDWDEEPTLVFVGPKHMGARKDISRCLAWTHVESVRLGFTFVSHWTRTKREFLSFCELVRVSAVSLRDSIRQVTQQRLRASRVSPRPR